MQDEKSKTEEKDSDDEVTDFLRERLLRPNPDDDHSKENDDEPEEDDRSHERSLRK